MTRAALLSALVITGLAGCAGALRDDLQDHPHGRFAETRVAAPANVRSVPTRPAPEGGGPALARRGETPPQVPPPGPVSAEDLAAIGVDVGPADLEPLRDDAWTPTGKLAYSDARAAFLARSPELGVAAQARRASFARYGQVGWLNDLVRQYDAFAVELRTGGTTTVLKPDEGMRFPLAGVAELQGEIVTVDVDQAQVAFERATLGALLTFEEAFQGALYWQRAVGILAKTVELAERVAGAANARYRAGGTSHANLIQAEIRLEDFRQRLRTARAERAAARLALGAALRLPSEAVEETTLSLDIALPERPTREANRGDAAAHGPSVADARLGVAKMELMVQLAERQLLPNLSPGLGPELLSSAPPARGDVRYATGGPFLAELRLRQVAARERLALALSQAPARADAAWVRLDEALRQRHSNAGHQSQRAGLAVDVAERGYAAGRATFFDLDAAVQLHLAIALKARAALRDAFIAAAKVRVEAGTGWRERAAATSRPEPTTPEETESTR